jgi:hypothetical protein
MKTALVFSLLFWLSIDKVTVEQEPIYCVSCHIKIVHSSDSLLLHYMEMIKDPAERAYFKRWKKEQTLAHKKRKH